MSRLMFVCPVVLEELRHKSVYTDRTLLYIFGERDVYFDALQCQLTQTYTITLTLTLYNVDIANITDMC